MLDRSALRRRPGSSLSFPGPTDLLFFVSDLLAAWERRARERRMLAEMSPRMLKDLGITPADARQEADKPFWRI